MMADGPKELRIYSTADGKKPFQEWIESLTDGEAKARILVRLERVRLGNLGDCKSVGEGVYVRIKIGPGYRVYFGRDGGVFVILLCGGSKATQRKDSKREGVLAGLQEQKTCQEAYNMMTI